MKILCTGAAGYVGSVLVPHLLKSHDVIAFDNFRSNNPLSLASSCSHDNFTLIRGDVRDVTALKPLVAKVDVVIPLAALVGAPLCQRFPNDAISTNLHAIDWLSASLSPDQRLIYPNTNSSYGKMSQAEPLTEDSPRQPLSLYAQVKDKAEESALCHHNTVVFRLATVFGASPRMRTDLLVNDFVLRAHRDHAITLFDPNARRNFVHIRDVARAFAWAINDGEGVYNLGHDPSNMTKAELVHAIAQHIPFTFHVADGMDPDQRDYVVSNQRLKDAGFEACLSVDYGVRELLKLYTVFPDHPWGNV